MKEERIRFNRSPPDDPIFRETPFLALAAMVDPIRRHRDDCIIHRLEGVSQDSRTCIVPRERPSGRAVEHPGFLMTLAYAFWANAAGLLANFPGDRRDVQNHLSGLIERSRDRVEDISADLIRDMKPGNPPADKGMATLVKMRKQIGDWIAEDAWKWGCCSCRAEGPPPFVPLLPQPITFVPEAGIEPYDPQTLTTPEITLDTASLMEVCHDQSREEVNFARDKRLAANPSPVRPFSRTAVLDSISSVQQPSPPREGHWSLVELYKRITKSSSTAKLDDLNIVRLASLKYPSTHDGKMLIVRVLTEPVVFGTGLKYMVEDEHGDSLALFTEYPLPKPALEYSASFIKAIHPVGAVLKVKEPFVHFGSLSGQPEILVSIPTDVKEVWGDGGVTWAYPSLVSASALKDAGNKALKDKKKRNPLLAMILYSRALGDPELNITDRFILVINRMQAAISAGRPGSAVRDSIEAAKLLQDGAEATDVQRHKFTERRQAALKLVNASGTKLGPIEFRATGNKGFGTFATAAIRAGTIIIDEDPLVKCATDPTSPYNYVAYFDGEQSPRTMNHWQTLGTAIHAAIDGPRKMAMWDRLHPRTIDVLREYSLDQPLEDQTSIDALAISTKINKNSNTIEASGRGSGRLDCAGREVVGVMVNPHYSGLNHSCLPNTLSVEVRGTAERAIAVARDIEAGEELCGCYCDTLNGQSLIARTAMLGNWNFRCDYRLMHYEWPSVPKSRLQDIPALERFLAKVEATYAVGRILKPESARVIFCMCIVARDPAEKFRYGKLALRAAGSVLCSESERCALERAVKSFQLEVFGLREIISLAITVEQAAKALAHQKGSRVTPAEAEAWSAASAWLRRIICPGYRD